MKDYPIITVIIFFLFTSLNCGEKTNDRRASGMLALPRVGRAPSFARPDGVAGLVQYPRVGRSGQAAVNNLEKIYSVNNDIDSSDAEAHQEETIDLNYQGEPLK
ncbi:hypothetical protein HCN44_004471 [Aphidius gifuensis]|uniref:Uncharacterized protein n=1 Tax=Aphidius gifuensis TaxID=684658 RepID=A0A835CTF4_APHGI|nr:hypothetical protein HCN44_004471 [Aphidius gifuensis]